MSNVDMVEACTAAARAILHAVYPIESKLSDVDRVRWWAGFFGAIAGYMAGSIGDSALGIIGAAVGEKVRAEFVKRAH